MRLIMLLLACATAFAHTGLNTITITASRNVTVVPDQVDYTIAVATGPSASVDEAVARLNGTAVTGANLTYVSSGPTYTSWVFDLVVPFSKMKETSAVLLRLSQTPGIG